MSGRYYSRVQGFDDRRPQRETVKRIIADRRRDYAPEQIHRRNKIRRDNERWRQDREYRLTVELENIGNKIDNMAENEEGSLPRVEHLWTKQAVLIKEIERLDLHSKYCWRRYRWRAYLETHLYWWTYWFQSVEAQAPRRLDTVTCYCPT